MYAGLLDLLGSSHIEGRGLAEWVSAWAQAYDACAPITGDPLLSSHRRAYYLKGFQALLEERAHHCVLTGLITSWDRVLATLEAYDMAAEHREAWDATLGALGLTPNTADTRADALEAFLDRIEVILEAWGREHGA